MTAAVRNERIFYVPRGKAFGWFSVDVTSVRRWEERRLDSTDKVNSNKGMLIKEGERRVLGKFAQINPHLIGPVCGKMAGRFSGGLQEGKRSDNHPKT